jgi:hypothetical protein
MRAKTNRNDPVFMNPIIFIGASVCLGLLFAAQEWVYSLRLGMHFGALVFFKSWGVQFLLFGTICWLLWRLFKDQVQRANVVSMLAFFLPLSIAISVFEEMVSALIFQDLPLNHTHLGYWQRVTMSLDAELFDNIVVFWCAFFLFRGIGYYQRFRENERTAAQLEIQLANAQIAALRMQLNPHFLFNAMNSISSLMRIEVDAADAMLEQLSSLMRITLERGDAQLITVRDEMEFIETYLAMQARRYAGRVEHALSVDPGLYDALVPSMLLQPIVENAFVHGLSKITTTGELKLAIERDGKQMKICIVNSGVGIDRGKKPISDGHAVGVANIRNRLKLHYGDKASFSLIELDSSHVQVTIYFPLQFSASLSAPITRFGPQ